jgi:hypothetical protein
MMRSMIGMSRRGRLQRARVGWNVDGHVQCVYTMILPACWVIRVVFLLLARLFEATNVCGFLVVGSLYRVFTPPRESRTLLLSVS